MQTTPTSPYRKKGIGNRIFKPSTSKKSCPNDQQPSPQLRHPYRHPARRQIQCRDRCAGSESRPSYLGRRRLRHAHGRDDHPPARRQCFSGKSAAGVFVGNGFGKSAGIPQINELGTLETPIVLTNTLSVAAGIDGLLSWTLEQPGNEAVKSVNAFVGETNDGRVNDIRARFVSPDHVIEALRRAESGPVEEGCCGAGTGTVAFGFKAGIGTASRKLPESLGGWTVGVIVQANFGGFLTVKGVEVGRQLGGWSNEKLLTQAMPAGWAERVKDVAGSADGSIMMIAATDAPLTQRSLERLAERAFMGMTRTGGIASNGSGDFALAFSTAPSMRVRHEAPYGLLEGGPTVRSDDMTPLFMAAIESTEEAILNALFTAHDTAAYDGGRIAALPREAVLQMLRKAGVLAEH